MTAARIIERVRGEWQRNLANGGGSPPTPLTQKEQGALRSVQRSLYITEEEKANHDIVVSFLFLGDV